MTTATAPRPAVVTDAQIDALLREVGTELKRATRLHGPMASGHEAVGVIDEEFMEYKSAVYWGVDQHGRPADPRAEAIQLAAMAVRYVLDIADRPTPLTVVGAAA